MEGNGTIEAQDRTGVDSRFQVIGAVNCSSGGKSYTLGTWQTATPPIFRCNTGLGPLDNFGRTMVANLPTSIKIGVVPVAIGGCDIALFHKQNYGAYVATAPSWMIGNINAYGGNPYGRLVEVAKLAQKEGVIKGVLLHQGETNNMQQDWPNKVKAIYDNLINDLGLDPTKVPLLVGELVTTAQGGSCGGHNSVIAKVPSIIPNSHVISAANLAQNGDGLHFTPAAYRTLGQRYAEKMLTLLPPASNITVNFTSPANNTTAIEGIPINLTVSATATTGSISNVKFYDGTTLLNTDNSSPYTYSWTNASLGTHTIKAVATDNSGKTAETTISIKVNIPQAPYQGKTHIIPGTIQLEEFDVGGNGSAYMDDTPGSETGVTFRSDEDVDIENCTDAGAGYNIGWTSAGEWLEYTTEVTKAGKYDLQLRVACNGADRTVSVSMDGEAIATDIAVPNTAGWQTWQTVTVPNIELMPGKKVMRLTIGATDFVNLNYVTFVLKEEYVKEPFNGTAHLIPGRIEAEEYDKGGEGLGYHEANANGNQGSATLRNDEVDIEATQDVDGDYNIGYTLTGEWLEYTVNVTTTAEYDLDIRVAKDGTGGLFHIEIDGVDITGPISVPNTGGWQVWQTITLNDISLTAGEHVMRIEFDTDYTNLNYVEFKGLVTDYSSLEKNGYKIYPNPFSNEGLIIESTGLFKYDVFNMNGASIESGQGTDLKMIGESLEKGVYLLKINEKTVKIIKE